MALQWPVLPSGQAPTLWRPTLWCSCLFLLLGCDGAGLGQLILKIENFFDDFESLVRRHVAVREQGCHLGLPAGVDVRYGHAGLGGLVVIAFQVSDQLAIGSQEEGVVVPSRVLEGVQHFRPDGCMPALVFVHQLRLDGRAETDPHVRFSRSLVFESFHLLRFKLPSQEGGGQGVSCKSMTTSGDWKACPRQRASKTLPPTHK